MLCSDQLCICLCSSLFGMICCVMFCSVVLPFLFQCLYLSCSVVLYSVLFLDVVVSVVDSVFSLCVAMLCTVLFCFCLLVWFVLLCYVLLCYV